MKISEHDALNISKPQSDRLSKAPKSGSDSPSAPTRSQALSDAVDVTGHPGLVLQALAVSSEERAGRIEQLRALVESGRYRVDSAILSSAIVTATLSGY
jgi:anti-sigma28 factor (negative regulator of flagellin synthesis)